MDPAIAAADRIRFLEDRLSVLSRGLREFAEATTDYERLLDIVARTLANVVKDGCVVRLLSEGGGLRPAAIHLPIERSLDEEAAALVRAHVALPHHLSGQSGAQQVMESGEALLIPTLDLQQLERASTPEIAQAYSRVGIHSLLLLPLRVRGESIGLLSLVRFSPSSPPFAKEDLELAHAIADHAALAISNARLLQGARRDLAERERAEKELHRAEAQLRHAQKLEAVGRLAGGIAHDFNNILSVILTYAEVIADDAQASASVREEVGEIKLAGERAAELTKQLLAFSRQQVFDARQLDLNQVIGGIERMLRRLLDADIELVTLPSPELGRIKADSGQVGQVLMNLAVNARDAMPRGGKLTLETRNVEIVADSAEAHADVTPGSWVLLSVSDDGCGMDRETLSRVFEPFFTTKEQGKGTGLGLSTVFGIVKQSAGHIWATSEPGKGTTFKLYFPRVWSASAVFAAPVSEPPLTALRGTETILLVEDDEPVRVLARGILRRSGYVVLDAANAGEALLICEQHGAKIDLLLTDVVLPRMSGRQLAERLAITRPGMKVLLTSGYADDTTIQGILESGVAWLQKPLTPGSLTRKVREVLG